MLQVTYVQLSILVFSSATGFWFSAVAEVKAVRLLHTTARTHSLPASKQSDSRSCTFSPTQVHEVVSAASRLKFKNTQN